MTISWPILSGGGARASVPAGDPFARLTNDRKIFLAGGQPWRWCGVSAFPLCDRFARGVQIGPLLRAFDGFNVLRVWDYVTWGGTGWESQPAEVWLAFLAEVGARGWRVELTLLTDDDPHRIDPAKRLVGALAQAKPTNLVLEIGNEPKTHKDIDCGALRDVCQRSGFPFSSGLTEGSESVGCGTYLTPHLPRDSDWPRKAHDLMEYYQGGGPGAPTDPAHPVPCLNDEPTRPDLAGYAHLDFRAHFGACALLGGGATFHYDGGKYCQLPTADDARCAMAALEGLVAFPASEPNQGYRRIDEHGATSRTYVVGQSMVRVRPTTLAAPEPGWTMIDTDGILWRRSDAQPAARGADAERVRPSATAADPRPGPVAGPRGARRAPRGRR